MFAVAERESNWNPLALGAIGEIGIFQLTAGVVDDFNRFHGTSNRGLDIYDPYINAVIAAWYLYDELPRLIKAGGKPVTVGNVLMAYNGGVGNLNRGTVSNAAINYAKEVSAAAGFNMNDSLYVGLFGVPWIAVAAAAGAVVWNQSR